MNNIDAIELEGLMTLEKAHLAKAEQAREDYRYHVAKAKEAVESIKSIREGRRYFPTELFTNFVELCY